MQAIQAQKLALDMAPAVQGGRSAREAASAVHKVQRLAALLQISQVCQLALFAPSNPGVQEKMLPIRSFASSEKESRSVLSKPSDIPECFFTLNAHVPLT